MKRPFVVEIPPEEAAGKERRLPVTGFAHFLVALPAKPVLASSLAATLNDRSA